MHARDLRIKAETSVLRLGGVSLFCPTNRECPTEKKFFRTTPPRQLFREKNFSGRIRLIPFSIQNFGHLPQNTSLSLIFSSIYQNFPHMQILLFDKLCKIFAQLHFYCPTSVSLKMLNLPDETTILQYLGGGGVTPPIPFLPTSFGPAQNNSVI